MHHTSQIHFYSSFGSNLSPKSKERNERLYFIYNKAIIFFLTIYCSTTKSNKYNHWQLQKKCFFILSEFLKRNFLTSFMQNYHFLEYELAISLWPTLKDTVSERCLLMFNVLFQISLSVLSQSLAIVCMCVYTGNSEAYMCSPHVLSQSFLFISPVKTLSSPYHYDLKG